MICWIENIILFTIGFFNREWFLELVSICFVWTVIATFFECLLKEN